MPATKNKIECPVCGMQVHENPRLKAEHKGQAYYFCSKSDMKKFQRQPQVYAWKEPREHAGKISKAA